MRKSTESSPNSGMPSLLYSLIVSGMSVSDRCRGSMSSSVWQKLAASSGGMLSLSLHVSRSGTLWLLVLRFRWLCVAGRVVVVGRAAVFVVTAAY